GRQLSPDARRNPPADDRCGPGDRAGNARCAARHGQGAGALYQSAHREGAPASAPDFLKGRAMTKAATISGILFDKDGTLLDYAKSWVPVNYELARIAAAGDEALARKLLV